MAAGRRRGARALGAAALLLLAGACASTDDARVLQVLNQRGFGRPTHDANRRYYIGISDQVVLRSQLYSEYNGVSERVRMDGTITLPDVGEVYVNGLTPVEATEVIRLRYESEIEMPGDLQLEVVSFNSKRYYITGVPPRRPASKVFRGDTTLMDVMAEANVDEILVDIDNILVIRGDPENPLVIECDFAAIKYHGRTRDNVLIRENDIVYLPPSLPGYLVWGVSILTAPVQPITQLFFGVNNVISVTDSFGQQTYGAGGGKFGKFNQF